MQALYSAGSDRAFWSARENLNTLGLPAPILPWRWRGDVEEAVTVIREKVELEERAGDGCMVCSMKWFDESDYVCRLKCGHYMCIECLTTIVDFAGRGNFTPEEEAAGKVAGLNAGCRAPAHTAPYANTRATRHRAVVLDEGRNDELLQRMPTTFDVQDVLLTHLGGYPAILLRAAGQR